MNWRAGGISPDSGLIAHKRPQCGWEKAATPHSFLYFLKPFGPFMKLYIVVVMYSGDGEAEFEMRVPCLGVDARV